MNEFDLIVAGGGPAGFFGALRFTELCPQASVLILEKSDAVLQKVLITGSGQCNITHNCNNPKELIKFYPRGSKALLNAFYQFGPEDVIQWFGERGLKFYCDDTGCYFPITDNAQSVVDILTQESVSLGIHVWTETGMESLHYNNETQCFNIKISNEDMIQSPLLLIATGGNRQGLKTLRDFGLDIIPPIPSLFAFQLQDPQITQLAGITVPNVALSLPGSSLRQTGPILITHRGLSGPVVINLSAWAARLLHESAYKYPLLIDWLPGSGPEAASLEILIAYKQKNGSQPLDKLSPFFELPIRLWKAMVGRTGLEIVKHLVDLTKAQLASLNQQVRRGEYQITGRDPHKQEYVTCGGVDLKQLDQRWFESKCYRGLCFAGEVLDVDGLTGGYNLQNCWSTAWVAAGRLAERMD